jgi:hypothetical protein
VVEVDFLAGNGFIYEDLDYLVSLVDKAQDSTTPNLQEVTDVGSITTNTITVGSLSGDFSQVLSTAIGTQNYTAGTYAYLDSSGYLGLNNGTVESYLKNTNVTNVGVILEFPNKPTGSYTIATTDDVPTASTLQEVTDEGNTTTNDIQLIDAAEVIFGAGGGILLDNGSRLRDGTIDAGLGGSKGIAQICAVGYELKWEAGRLYVMDGNGVYVRWSLYNFNITPTINDDVTKGYLNGSRWTLDNGDVYECTDSTASAAVWELVNTGVTPTLQEVVTEGNYINDNTIEFYESGNLHGSIGGSQTFLNFNNYTSGNLKYLLDTFNGFSTYVQDETEYSILDATSIGFVNTIKTSNFNVNGFSTTTFGSPTSKTLSINFPTTIVGTNKTQTFQDADGTIALLSDIPSGGVTSVTATSPITSSGGATPDISTSMATNKLIGRSTAGTGVMEEITVGTGLSLSGGTLNATAQTVGFEQNFLLMGA